MKTALARPRRLYAARHRRPARLRDSLSEHNDLEALCGSIEASRRRGALRRPQPAWLAPYQVHVSKTAMLKTSAPASERDDGAFVAREAEDVLLSLVKLGRLASERLTHH